jgi:hypothetical protein
MYYKVRSEKWELFRVAPPELTVKSGIIKKCYSISARKKIISETRRTN